MEPVIELFTYLFIIYIIIYFGAVMSSQISQSFSALRLCGDTTSPKQANLSVSPHSPLYEEASLLSSIKPLLFHESPVLFWVTKIILFTLNINNFSPFPSHSERGRLQKGSLKRKKMIWKRRKQPSLQQCVNLAHSVFLSLWFNCKYLCSFAFL